jgi:hypothetical protein
MKSSSTCQFDQTGEIPDNLPRITACGCKAPEITEDNPNGVFWCEAHGRRKTARQFVQCATDPKLFINFAMKEAPPNAKIQPTANQPGKKPCGGGTEPVIKYSAEDREFALSLCRACEHYNAETDHCEEEDCPRLARLTCSQRVASGRDKCPIGKW